MNIFAILVAQPITNVLVAIYHGLYSVGVPYALGFAIIILTVIIRFLLYPLTTQQLRASKKMQDMAPHLNKIKEKHKGDMRAQQEATMALYREHGINPLAGCVPALLQLPIFFGLYGVLRSAVGSKTIEEVNKALYTDSLKLSHMWDTNFFGLPLGKTPRELLPTVGVGILLVSVVTALLQFMQSKMMMAKTAEEKQSQVTVEKKPADKGPDFASVFQTQTVYFLLIMIGVFSFGFPIGLSLYWNTFSLFGIIQQYRIAGWGGLNNPLRRK